MAFLLTGLDAGIVQASEVSNSVPYSINVFDESSGLELSDETLDTLPDSLFKNFITSISTLVTNKIEQLVRSDPSATGKPKITFFFIYKPLILTQAAKLPERKWPEIVPSNGTYSLRSPWVQIFTNRSPSLTVQAVFIWNERQVLLDQALLAGANLPAPDSPQSISVPIFEQYVQDYSETVLLASSPEERIRAQKNIAERVPPDILWLFRHAWQSTFAPFSMEARHALGLALKHAMPVYIDLTEKLTNRCFTEERKEEHYHSLFELQSIVNIDAYRIDRIH